jgi:hypothetical protein
LLFEAGRLYAQHVDELVASELCRQCRQPRSLQGTEMTDQRRHVWQPLVGEVALAFKKDGGSVSGLELGPEGTQYVGGQMMVAHQKKLRS